MNKRAPSFDSGSLEFRSSDKSITACAVIGEVLTVSAKSDTTSSRISQLLPMDNGPRLVEYAPDHHYPAINNRQQSLDDIHGGRDPWALQSRSFALTLCMSYVMNRDDVVIFVHRAILLQQTIANTINRMSQPHTACESKLAEYSRKSSRRCKIG
jgi:hypothetical protein